jgi:hypothetical protein
MIHAQRLGDLKAKLRQDALSSRWPVPLLMRNNHKTVTIAGSSMKATMFLGLPQFGQTNTSLPTSLP